MLYCKCWDNDKMQNILQLQKQQKYWIIQQTIQHQYHNLIQWNNLPDNILIVDKTDKWKANKNPEEQNAQWTKLQQVKISRPKNISLKNIGKNNEIKIVAKQNNNKINVTTNKSKVKNLNSATHIVRNKFKILSNNILPGILPCQKIHLT